MGYYPKEKSFALRNLLLEIPFCKMPPENTREDM